MRFSFFSFLPFFLFFLLSMLLLRQRIRLDYETQTLHREYSYHLFQINYYFSKTKPKQMTQYKCEECGNETDEPRVVFNRVSDELRCPKCNSEELNEKP